MLTTDKHSIYVFKMAEKVSSIFKTTPSLFSELLDFKLTSFQYSEATLLKATL